MPCERKHVEAKPRSRYWAPSCGRVVPSLVWGKVTGRFMMKVKHDPATSCWMWTGAKNGAGYGIFNFNGKSRNAHRVMWMMIYGEIPAGMCVMHMCDTPACVNPSHLAVGSIQENNADMAAKGRQVRGSLVGTAEMTEETASWARVQWKLGLMARAKIAETLGVSERTIRNLLDGQSWKSLAACDESPWRSMDSAPKTEPVLAVVDGDVRVVRYGKTSHVPLYGWCIADMGPEDCDLCVPTNWMPLPAAPEVQK